MVSQLDKTNVTEIIYPDSDGQPMADNTLQFRWITTIKTNLDWLFRQQSDVFVAGDLLWYPVENDNIAFLIHKRYSLDPEQLNQQRFNCAAQMRETL